ncbi:unnamed protein product [Sphagnum jensenii]|uniref:Uncharacterized protein n=1 Tax=Sphagnum jensenii TaxID=128206 RepID=A0ABP0VA34_9BRYO
MKRDYVSCLKGVEDKYQSLLREISNSPPSEPLYLYYLGVISDLYGSAKKNLEIVKSTMETIEAAIFHFKGLCAAPQFNEIIFNVKLNSDFVHLDIYPMNWINKLGLSMNRDRSNMFEYAKKFKATTVLEDDYNILPIAGGAVYWRGREFVMVSNMGFARKTRLPEPIIRVIMDEFNAKIVITGKGAYNILNENMVAVEIPADLDVKLFDKYISAHSYTNFGGYRLSDYLDSVEFSHYHPGYNLDHEESNIYGDSDACTIGVFEYDKKIEITQVTENYSRSETTTRIYFGRDPEDPDETVIDCGLANVDVIKDVKFNRYEQKLYISVPYVPEKGQRGKLIVVEEDDD